MWNGGLFVHQPDPAVEGLVANKGRVASPVKAFSRRRRGPKASLYWACWLAILVPPRLTAARHRLSLHFPVGLRRPCHRADPGKRAPN